MEFNIDSHFDSDKNQWSVTIIGEIDIFNSDLLKSKLNELITEKKSNVYLDCKNLEYIDSTALGALVSVLKNIKLYGGEMIIANVKSNLAKLFKITNLDKVFVIEVN